MIYLILIIILVLVVYIISTGNRFKSLEVKIQESLSGIDVSLTQRFDVLTKLLSVCRQYAAHETETFEKLVGMRQNMTVSERTEYSGKMDRLTDQIRAVAEGYPELRSSTNYLELQKAIRDTEDRLQASRRIYNSNVSQFNQMLVQFPSSIIGNKMNLKPADFFRADEAKRQDVQV